MKIQDTHTIYSANPLKCEKINAGNFEELLKNHMKPAGIELLVKDAFSDVKAEVLQEIENITSDETGKNIDMETLRDLLELL